MAYWAVTVPAIICDPTSRKADSGGPGGTRQTAYSHARRFALEAKARVLYDKDEIGNRIRHRWQRQYTDDRV